MERTMFSGAFSPRRAALGGSYSSGNLEWWGYQQSFLPQLYFSRPRVQAATLGSSHPPAPGVCCQKDKAGNTVCSDGFIGPPG